MSVFDPYTDSMAIFRTVLRSRQYQYSRYHNRYYHHHLYSSLNCQTTFVFKDLIVGDVLVQIPIKWNVVSTNRIFVLIASPSKMEKIVNFFGYEDS